MMVDSIELSDLEFGSEKLGSGGTGTVYKGRWKSRNMTVAIKSLTQKVPEKELEIMSLVNHPHIVQFVGAVLSPPIYCIVTEYAEQGSLYDFLHQNVLDPDRNLMWARQIAAGMKYLHFDVPANRVVIHGDLKSSNVLIVANTAKICDFGSSKVRELLQGKSLQTTTKIFGTMRWMAPEILENKPVSKQCDVYSYGMVVWELLTHQIPFSDVNDFQIYNTVVVNKELPPLPATCEPTLVGLLRSCWNHDPRSRPEFTVIVTTLEQLPQMFVDSGRPQPIPRTKSGQFSERPRPVPRPRKVAQLAAKPQPVPRPRSPRNPESTPSHLGTGGAQLVMRQRSPQFGKRPKPTVQLETGSVSETEVKPTAGPVVPHAENKQADNVVALPPEVPPRPRSSTAKEKTTHTEIADEDEDGYEDLEVFQEAQLQPLQEARFQPLQEANPSWAISRDEIDFLDEEIGRGSWGVVKKARFRGEVVAAKYLHEVLQVEPNLLQAFKREMNIAANLRHPNLVLFLGATTEGELIILSELMDSSLRALLAQGWLSQVKIKSFTSDVARALNYLHSWRPHPLIHRDVSSANVLLECLGSDSWKAKVSDYGSLKAINLASTVGPGNPVYSAPEAMQPGPQSCKMDTYSFGVLLIEMCTGEFPIPEERARLLREIKWPEMQQLIERCIQANPADRPTMLDIISALENLSRMLPIQQPQAQTYGDMRWFAPTMSRADAVNKLTVDGRQGSFLVRLSSSGNSKYSLSVCHQGKVSHYRIRENHSQECYIEDNYQFQTLEELIEFYKNTQAGLLTTLCEYPPKGTVPSYTAVLNDEEWNIPKSELTFDREVARGQCGYVAAGTCKGSKVAIRVTKQEAMNETGLQFLGDAVRILKEFQHDNLVKMFGICAQEGPILIVTELMAKGPLDKYLRQHPHLLQNREILLGMAINICSAMMFLEEKKIPHGDLAARNCLVGEKKVVKVADYSMALYTSPRKPSRTVVSVRWAAPELIARTVTFTTKSDVWSFGVLLWEIWTGGQLPYPNMSNKEVKDKLPGGYRLEKPDNCPQELYELMHSCWKLNSDQRPSFSSLDKDLATMIIYEDIPEDDEDTEEIYDDTVAQLPPPAAVTRTASGVGRFWPFRSKLTHSGST